MSTKDNVREIWSECFDDTPQWIDMFFSEVYRDDEAVTLCRDKRMVSALMLQQYSMNFHGCNIQAGYICGAATLTPYRGDGCMTELMSQALRQSYKRGDVVCTLIPANDGLYRFYENLGFSPAFHINLERYSSAHTFTPSGQYTATDPSSADGAYTLFQEMMMQRPCCIQHSREQWQHILKDISIDGGCAYILSDADGNGAAIVFAVPVDNTSVRITDILARDSDARLGALSLIRKKYGNLPIEVYGYFDAPQGTDTPRGSMRIINVYMLLRSLAASCPELKANIKVYDPILGQNSHIYTIDRGFAVINDGYMGALDYDVDIEVLTSMVFGNDVTRKILDFPATRPFISLMLD